MKNKLMLYGQKAILAAVSGGADSMALLQALLELKNSGIIDRLETAHFNHMLRPESQNEQHFVEDFCRARGLICHVGFPKAALARGEDAARKARYEFLTATAKERGLVTATAHTADDNLETLLLVLTRGGGLNGLGGISPVRDAVIRPMLSVTRAEVELYLKERFIDNIEDSSNGQDIYTRNRLRRYVVPVLKDINPKVAENSAEMIASLRLDNEFLEQCAKECFLKAERCENGFVIAQDILKNLHSAVRVRVWKLLAGGLERVHINALEKMLESSNPHYGIDLPNGLRARRLTSKQGVSIAVGKPPETRWELSVRKFTWEQWVCIGKINKKFNSFACNSAIIGRVTLRGRMEGDRMRVAGRQGSKTLKKLMIEHKIPMSLRSDTPVLADEKGIVAVAGIGVSHRCRVIEGNGVTLFTLFEKGETVE